MLYHKDLLLQYVLIMHIFNNLIQECNITCILQERNYMQQVVKLTVQTLWNQYKQLFLGDFSQ